MAHDNVAHYVVNDTPTLNWTFEEMDLTGFTVTFHLKRTSGVVSRVAVLDDAPNGVFHHDVLAGDFDAAENMEAELEFDDGAGKVFTLPEDQTMLFIIRDELA